MARRTERAVVTLAAAGAISAAPRLFLNRLSDLLFVLARVLSRASLDLSCWAATTSIQHSARLARNLDPDVA